MSSGGGAVGSGGGRAFALPCKLGANGCYPAKATASEPAGLRSRQHAYWEPKFHLSMLNI
jgi:hypothetical protein